MSLGLKLSKVGVCCSGVW